jgi:hypothetical protein
MDTSEESIVVNDSTNTRVSVPSAMSSSSLIESTPVTTHTSTPVDSKTSADSIVVFTSEKSPTQDLGDSKDLPSVSSVMKSTSDSSQKGMKIVFAGDYPMILVTREDEIRLYLLRAENFPWFVSVIL